ncbi:MAG: diacylglycerol kinase [Patescibacteria group bacterium]
MAKNKQTLGQSFAGAFRGLRYVLAERNFRVQLALGALAVLLVYVFGFSRVEIILVLIISALVLGSEALNTALEYWLDHTVGRPDPVVAQIKEISAAVVLIFSLTAIVIALVLFGSLALK